MPYMGPEGCRVSPVYRPACALWVCNDIDPALLVGVLTSEDMVSADGDIDVALSDPLVSELFGALKVVKVIKVIKELREDWPLRGSRGEVD